MSRPLTMFLAVSAIAASAAGCAGFGAPAEGAPDADKIPVYQSEPPGRRSYALVQRVWTASWRSAAWVPGYSSVAEATADFREQAAAAGGDAVVHFNCARYDASIPPEANPKLFCNGSIVKYH